MSKEKFTLFKSEKNSQFYWNLKASNGEIILQSEGYHNKHDALNGIVSVKTHAPSDHFYERLKAVDGSFYFVLKAKNSKVIGVSEMYKTAASRDNGIESVKRNAPGAEIDDQTLDDASERAQAVSEAEKAGSLVITSASGGSYSGSSKGGYYGQA